MKRLFFDAKWRSSLKCCPVPQRGRRVNTARIWLDSRAVAMLHRSPRRLDSPTAATRPAISQGLVVLLASPAAQRSPTSTTRSRCCTRSHDAFGVSEESAGLLITITQFGLRARAGVPGPVGDLRERRGADLDDAAGHRGRAGIAAAAPLYAVFGAALGVVGVTSTVAQVIVPMSSSLAAEHERGRVVGTVMSGLLIGILTRAHGQRADR